jgi:hypothetical protein
LVVGRVDQKQANSEHERKEHHREDVVVRRCGDHVARNDVEERLDAGRPLGGSGQYGARAVLGIGKQRLREHRIDAGTRLEDVRHGQSDHHRDG